MGLRSSCVIFLRCSLTHRDSFVSGAIGASETLLRLFLSRYLRFFLYSRNVGHERNCEENEKPKALMVMHYSDAIPEADKIHETFFCTVRFEM